jgi:hypothetical protein
MNPLNIGLGVLAGLIYAFLGYSSQEESFSWKKFLRTIAIATLTALGLDFGNVTTSIYSAVVGPTAITVFLQKLIDTAQA